MRRLVVRRSLIVRFRDGCEPIGFRDPPLPAVVVGQVRVAIEKKQMRVEELALAAKDPHEYLHREDIDQETSVQPNPSHRFHDYLTADLGASTDED